MMEFWKKIDRLVSEELKVMYVGAVGCMGRKMSAQEYPYL